MDAKHFEMAKFISQVYLQRIDYQFFVDF